MAYTTQQQDAHKEARRILDEVWIKHRRIYEDEEQFIVSNYSGTDKNLSIFEMCLSLAGLLQTWHNEGRPMYEGGVRFLQLHLSQVG